MAKKKKTKKKKSPEKKKKKLTRKKKKGSLLFKFIKWCLTFLIWLFIFGAILLLYYGLDLPDVSKMSVSQNSPTITILDKNNNMIKKMGSSYGNYVPYSKMPKSLINAVVATEDRRFFNHQGIDLIGLARALYVNLRAGRIVQGGSTITQQLAKVMFLNPKRNIKRKIQEALLAVYLERYFSKEDILTMYLNRIYLGSGNYGIDAAAKAYFDKEVADLNLYESAVIAGLIKAPSRYNPIANQVLAKERARQVLVNMQVNNYIDSSYMPSDAYAVNNSKYTTSYNNYFVDWVLETLPDYVGRIDNNLTIKTTIDPEIQKIIYENTVSRLALNKEKLENTQAAAIVMKKDGAVVAMLGGKDYNDSQYNRAYKAKRQPGSAFKLFTYVTAFENGFTPGDEITDEPITIGKWSPKNYNQRYMGDISIRSAFAYSSNSVAVRVADSVGIQKIIEAAHTLGIESEINNNLSSALGASEVSLLELTTAYSHLNNNGISVWNYGIEKITDDDGNVLYEREENPNIEVLSADTTAKTNDLLISVVEYGTGKAAKIEGRTIAGKTGTSQDYRDAWFIGFSGDYTAGIWLGNDDNSPMPDISGGSIPALIWHDSMAEILKDTADQKIPVSASNVKNSRKEEDDDDTESFWDMIFGGESVKHEYPE